MYNFRSIRLDPSTFWFGEVWSPGNLNLLVFRAFSAGSFSSQKCRHSAQNCSCSFVLGACYLKQSLGQVFVDWAYQYCSIVWRRLVIVVLELELEFRIGCPFRPFQFLSDLNFLNLEQLLELRNRPRSYHSVVGTGQRCRLRALLWSIKEFYNN